MLEKAESTRYSLVPCNESTMCVKTHRMNLNDFEIGFILDSLTRDKELLERIGKEREALRREVEDLRKELLFRDGYMAIKSGLVEKKRMLADLEAHRLLIYNSLRIQEQLIIRFKDILAGKKPRGGRPSWTYAYTKLTQNKLVP